MLKKKSTQLGSGGARLSSQHLGSRDSGSWCVRGQPGLQSEFQDSQDCCYTEKPCLDKKVGDELNESGNTLRDSLGVEQVERSQAQSEPHAKVWPKPAQRKHPIVCRTLGSRACTAAESFVRS